MNLTMLKTLLVIIERGSFSAAAEAVGCSPSAVSLQVKQLESFFGKPLFDRSTRKVTPTPFALGVCAEASDFIGRIDALRDRPHVTVSGKLHIGVITSMQSDAMPHALQKLRIRYPKLDVRVAPFNDTDELLVELKAGRIDAALLVRPESGGSSRLVWRDLHRQPFVMLAPADSAASDPRKLIETYEWIGYDTRLPAGRQAAQFVRGLVPSAHCLIELRSMDAIVSMISLGMGIAVVPEPRRPLLKAYPVREIVLGRKLPQRRISFVWRLADNSNRNIAAVSQAFAEVFLKTSHQG